MDDNSVIILRTIPLSVWNTLTEHVNIFLDKDLTGSITLSLNYDEGELLTYDVSGKEHHRVTRLT